MKITSSLISLVLTLVGGILLISGILDYIFALIPAQWEDLSWQINLINGFVDQGIVPLIGICLLFIAWWIEDSNNKAKPSFPLRFSLLTISCLFGLFFLLLIPLHLNNVNQISNDVISKIDQQVAQQEEQLQGFIGQLRAVSQDPVRLKQEVKKRAQVLNSGGIIQGQQLTAQQLQIISNEHEQLKQLLDLSQQPDALKSKLDDMKTNLESKLKERENTEKKKAQSTALQQSLKTSILSFILAIAYTVIGWFGLRAIMTKVP